MKENKYDDETFFEQYSQMNRSINGLSGAGEWNTLQKMLPDFKDKRVLDLGCGFGWHCRYAIDRGALSVMGIDISEKMLHKAKEINQSAFIRYECVAIEDFEYVENSFDIVISSLAFHYISSFEELCKKIYRSLTPGGWFVFSVEHPVFTAEGSQDWEYDKKGDKKYWPVDRYFEEGVREANFLGEKVVKYHRTLTTYINALLKAGFEICELIEPVPDKRLLETVPDMKEELRRPMMLLVSAVKG